METVMDPTVLRGWPGAMIVDRHGPNTEIDDNKGGEEKLRQSEEDLRTIIDTIRQVIVVCASDGTTLYANRVVLDLTGLTLDEVKNQGFFQRAFHPDDVDRFRTERQEGFLRGDPFELEMRGRLKSGQYRWFLCQFNPLKDESDRVIRWYCTATDIDDRKRTEERLQGENFRLGQERVFLEEQIRSEMGFERIIGNSPVLKQALELVETVAPSDSTVLLLGETGTGKELIARAIHKRSLRAARAFVSVNCAAVPPSLIASELFGHEKGAFTGATQRRLGRFELAEGGTLFIDEVGELPLETQISLLRVLQEREFERLGGTKVIPANVRVIAATNRDLPASIAAGGFRSDLYYRLNVFPMEMPPLRERKEDIHLLVEYFIDRYASKAGKKIRAINRATLDRLKAYAWPGNIRELQNVIERSVILCETENFTVDESWLSRKLDTSEQTGSTPLRMPPSQEKKTIEAALADAQGRISGPSGAASRLGIPPSTLDSKIRALKIDKHRFKTS